MRVNISGVPWRNSVNALIIVDLASETVMSVRDSWISRTRGREERDHLMNVGISLSVPMPVGSRVSDFSVGGSNQGRTNAIRCHSLCDSLPKHGDEIWGSLVVQIDHAFSAFGRLGNWRRVSASYICRHDLVDGIGASHKRCLLLDA